MKRFYEKQSSVVKKKPPLYNRFRLRTTAKKAMQEFSCENFMIETNTGNFDIPEEFLSKDVVIRLAIPIMQGGLSFPEMTAVLVKDLQGAVLLKQEDGDLIVLPKSRIWTIGVRSEIAVVSGIIKPH